jgi:hypothetical protein
MNAIIVELENRPGELARATGALGRAGVNITNGVGLALTAAGAFGFLTDNEAGAMSALQAAGLTCRMVEVVETPVADEAGGLAVVAQRLADAGVNVELLLPVGMRAGAMQVAFGVDDASKARSALG